MPRKAFSPPQALVVEREKAKVMSIFKERELTSKA